MGSVLKGFLIGLFVLFSAHASATEMREMLISALANGSSEGVLTGAVADKWSATTRSKNPVKVRVKRVLAYQQSGCGRLSVELKQDGAIQGADGRPAPMATVFALNMCSTGEPPAPAPDVVSPPVFQPPVPRQ